MSRVHYAHVNQNREVVLPPQLARELGLTVGEELRIEADGSGVHLYPSVHALKRIYVEATNQCNLTCSTCMRNVWDVKYGRMSEATFERVLTGFDSATDKPEIFFGGYGEPLSHPRILAMIELAKSRGHRVSLITNGILLTESIRRSLIDLRLDMLWVSLDGASAECYVDVRLGDSLPLIIENLRGLCAQKYLKFGASNWSGRPRLGIAFVAMRRNIHDLAEVIRLGSRLGATEFSISNVLAHNDELYHETLYTRAMSQVAGQQIRPTVRMPLMDVDPQTASALAGVMKDMNRLELAGGLLNQNTDRCPFVERGSLAVRWDGKISPCLPLLYTHTHFLDDRKRISQEYFVGDVHERDLLSIWDEKQYRELRLRLRDFDFSPCVFCNSCEMASANLEDCFGNTQPACGGCLWARGLISCP